MANIRLDMTMSLDGFVAGPKDDHDDPMGVGGFRLFNWLDHRNEPGPHGEAFAEAMATRAFISGRHTYELANHWQGDHHDGVPIFVLTHDVPDEPPPGTVRFMTDVSACAAAAREAAGDADVGVHGAGAGQSLLQAGELDELAAARRTRPPRPGEAALRPPARRLRSSSWSARSAPPRSCTCATAWPADLRAEDVAASTLLFLRHLVPEK